MFVRIQPKRNVDDYRTSKSIVTRSFSCSLVPFFSFVDPVVAAGLRRFSSSAERRRVHQSAVSRYRLPAEKRAGLYLIRWTVSRGAQVLFGTAHVGDVLALVDQIVHGLGHDGGERTQRRLRQFRERRH